MIAQQKQIFSPQATEIYRLLLENNALTAKNIAKELHIFPNAVYRAVKQLLEKGFVKQIDSYPTSYAALPQNEALELYSANLQQNFQQLFTTKILTNARTLDIAFLRTREDLRQNTDADVATAQHSVHFIVSGLEVPAETILTYKQAIERGVTVRALVQQLDDTSEHMFKNWKKIGLHVKYSPNMEARTFIIDKKIVYFTSYSPNKKEEAIGMRFAYVPYARIMNELFEQRWNMGKEI